jgi:hypothetical protein
MFDISSSGIAEQFDGILISNVLNTNDPTVALMINISIINYSWTTADPQASLVLSFLFSGEIFFSS